MDISSANKPSDQPFHSPASFNVISIAGIHFAYISCCYVAQWARMKPNCAKTVFILNFAADSSGALKCSFFYLLCSPFRLNNEMLNADDAPTNLLKNGGNIPRKL